LTEAVGNVQSPSRSYTLKRAEPWSIVGHGSDFASLPRLAPSERQASSDKSAR